MPNAELSLHELQACLNSDLPTACKRGLSRLRRSTEAATADSRRSPLLASYLDSSPLCIELLGWFDGVMADAAGHRSLATELYRTLAAIIAAMAAHGHAARAPTLASALIERMPKRFVAVTLGRTAAPQSKATDDTTRATLLALLAAITSTGAAAALRLLPHLELRSKEMQALFWEQPAARGTTKELREAPPLKKRRRKGGVVVPAEWSVRSQCVRLAVAFLACDAADVRRAALIERGVAAGVVAGLKHDLPVLAALAVAALRALVASSASSGGHERGLVRRIFNSRCVVQQLVPLYAAGDEAHAKALPVIETLRHELDALFAALLLATDSPLRTAAPGDGGRGVVHAVILCLQPRSDTRQRALLFAVLERHPWAMRRFLAAFKFRLEPPSTKAGSDTTPLDYLHDVSLLVQTLAKAAAHARAMGFQPAGPPNGVGRTVLSRALQSDNALVRFASATALLALLRLLRSCPRSSELDQKFLVHLPGVQVLVAAAKRERGQLTSGALRAEASADAVYARVLAALLCFVELFPESFVDARVDARKFALPALVDAPLPVQESTLRLLRAAATSRLEWFQVASSSGGSGIVSVLQIALAAASGSHYPPTIGVRFGHLAFAVVADALGATGLFANDAAEQEQEPQLWLQPLATRSAVRSGRCIAPTRFLTAVVQRYAGNPQLLLRRLLHRPPLPASPGFGSMVALALCTLRDVRMKETAETRAGNDACEAYVCQVLLLLLHAISDPSVLAQHLCALQQQGWACSANNGGTSGNGEPQPTVTLAQVDEVVLFCQGYAAARESLSSQSGSGSPTPAFAAECWAAVAPAEFAEEEGSGSDDGAVASTATTPLVLAAVFARISPFRPRRRFDGLLARAAMEMQPNEVAIAARTICGCALFSLSSSSAGDGDASARVDVELDFSLLRSILASCSADEESRTQVYRAVLSPAVLNAALLGADDSDNRASFALYATYVALWVAEAPRALSRVVTPFVEALVKRVVSCLERWGGDDAKAKKKKKKKKKTPKKAKNSQGLEEQLGAFSLRLLLCVLPCVEHLGSAEWLSPLIALTARTLAANTGSSDLRHLLSMLVSACLARLRSSHGGKGSAAPMDAATFAALVSSTGSLGMISRVLTHSECAPDYLATLSSTGAVNELFARSVADLQISWFSRVCEASGVVMGGSGVHVADGVIATASSSRRSAASMMLAQLLRASLQCRHNFARIWSAMSSDDLPTPSLEELALLLPIACEFLLSPLGAIDSSGSGRALAATLLPVALRALSASARSDVCTLESGASRLIHICAPLELIETAVATAGLDQILANLTDLTTRRFDAINFACIECIDAAFALHAMLRTRLGDSAMRDSGVHLFTACMLHANLMLAAVHAQLEMTPTPPTTTSSSAPGWKVESSTLFSRIVGIARKTLPAIAAVDAGSAVSNALFSAQISTFASGTVGCVADLASVDVACVALSLLSDIAECSAIGHATVDAVIECLRGAAAAQLDGARRESESSVAIVQLVETCFVRRPEVPCALPLGELAASYGATLSAFDRAVLSLMRRLDASRVDGAPAASIGFLHATGLRWGKSVGAAGAAVRAVTSSSKQLHSHDLELALLRSSAANFEALPARVTSNFEEGAAQISGKKKKESGTDTVDKYGNAVQRCYDPSFVLPLLKHLWVATRKPNFGSFIRVGALSYVVMAMSSPSESLRVQAYALVARVYDAMDNAVQAARKEEESETKTPSSSGLESVKRQHHLVLHTLKNALHNPFEQLSALMCAFVGEALQVMSQATHPVFVPLNRFLLSRPALDLSDLPMFYGMFNSGDAAGFRTQRAWMLRLILSGLQSERDHALLARRHAYTIMMGFHESLVSDAFTRDLVLRILCRACAIPVAAASLLHVSKLVPWMRAVLDGRHGATALPRIVAIVSRLVASSSTHSRGMARGGGAHAQLLSLAVHCIGCVAAADEGAPVVVAQSAQTQSLDDAGSPVKLQKEQLLLVLVDSLWFAVARNPVDAEEEESVTVARAGFELQPLDVLSAVIALRARREREPGSSSSALDVAERRLAAVVLVCRSSSEYSHDAHASGQWKTLISFVFSVLMKPGNEDVAMFADRTIESLWELVQEQRAVRTALASGVEARALLSILRTNSLSSDSDWRLSVSAACKLAEIVALVLPLRLRERHSREAGGAVIVGAIARSVAALTRALKTVRDERALRMVAEGASHVLRSAWLGSDAAFCAGCGECAALLRGEACTRDECGAAIQCLESISKEVQ